MHLKKIVSLVCVFFVLAMGVYAQYSVELPAKNVTIENVDGKAVFHGMSTYGKPGQPSLPVYNVTFLLPPGTDPADVAVAVQNPITKELAEDLYVAPAFPPMTSDTVATGEYPKDMSVYGNGANFPGAWTGTVTFGKLRQYQLADVAVNPCMYNPVTKKIKMLTGGTLVLTIKNQTVVDQKKSILNGTQRITNQIDLTNEAFLQKLIANPEAIAGYATESRNSTLQSETATLPGYVIITTNAIANASNQLQNFINQKNSQGYNVILAKESTWGGGTGDVAAERIRTWLRNTYASNNVKYVLLIGNPDPQTGDVPMKLTYPLFTTPSGYAAVAVPTDFYYAELTSNSWDSYADGAIGTFNDYSSSGGPDKYAEVAVGRIPYYGTITDLDKILAKSITYANATDCGWRKKILLPMVPSDDVSPGFPLGERIKTDFCMPNQWSYFRLYDERNTSSGYPIADVVSMLPPPESRSCTEPKVLDAWTSDAFGLVVWFTHGFDTYAVDVFSSQNTVNLSDSRPSMTFQNSCNNAWPEEPNNLAYKILLNGGITTIGATRVSFYSFAQTEFANTSTNAGLAYGYAQRIIADGKASGDSLIETYALTGSGFDAFSWWNVVVFNLYGCPDLALNIPADMPAAPTYLKATATSPSSVTLQWTDNATTETGYKVESAQNGGTYGEIASLPANSTSYINTGLSLGTKYKYRVRAVNGSVYSLYSNNVATTTFANIAQGKTATASSEQTGYASANAVDGNSSSTLWHAANGTFPQWLQIDLGGAFPLSGCELVFETTGTSGDCYDYTITTSTNNTDWTTWVDLPDNTNTSQTQTHSFNTTARYIRISLSDAPGSNWAGIYEFRVSGSPCPAAPVWQGWNPTLDNQLIISWTQAAGAMNYTLKRSTVDGGPYYPFATCVTTTSFATSDLVPGTQYYFVVSANNEWGESANSGQLNVTPIFTVPLAPINLLAFESPANLNYVLMWTLQSLNENGIIIERTEYGQSNWTVIGEAGHHTGIYHDDTVSSYETYEYRIHTYNSAGSSPVSMSATPSLNAPSNLTASLHNNTTVDLSWTSNSLSQQNFKIDRSTDGVNFQLLSTVGPDQSTFNDTTTTAGFTYHYRIRAHNAAGDSGYSDAASITLPNPPGAISVYYKAQETASTTNTIRPWFKIKNTGTNTLNLSNVKLRYYFTREGTVNQAAACDYAGLGGTNITSYVSLNFTPISPALSGANYYLEIGFNSGAGSLAPGQETDAIQIRFWKTDWSSYTQTGDYSFNSSMTTFTLNTNITGYVTGNLVFGNQPQ
jgi:hypothetical protein